MTSRLAQTTWIPGNTTALQLSISEMLSTRPLWVLTECNLKLISESRQVKHHCMNSQQTCFQKRTLNNSSSWFASSVHLVLHFRKIQQYKCKDNKQTNHPYWDRTCFLEVLGISGASITSCENDFEKKSTWFVNTTHVLLLYNNFSPCAGSSSTQPPLLF